MPLIILDRDGVINYDSDDYIKSPAEWVAIPGSLTAIARLNQAGYRVVIASNQSGLARGLFDTETLEQIHAKLRHELAQAGGVIEAIFFCPHSPQDDCPCRKPKPGMLRDIAKTFRCDLTGVPVVGDSLRDVQAALAVGADPILVRSGKSLDGLIDSPFSQAIPVYDDLAAVVDGLLSKRSRC